LRAPWSNLLLGLDVVGHPLGGRSAAPGRPAGGPLEVLVGAHRQVAEDAVVLAHPVLHLGQRGLADLAADVEQDVFALVDLVDGIGELAPPPVLFAGDLGSAGRDHVLVILHHGDHFLVGDARVDHEHQLVRAHGW